MTTTCTAKVHGTALAYDYGCRHDTARDAHRIYRKRLREGRHTPQHIDSTGTARRLQALAAIGWPCADLGDRLGCEENVVQQWRRPRSRRVYRRSAAAVARLYEQLSATPGPSERTRRHAREAGWAPPLLWEGVDIDDPNARPAVDGQVSPMKRIDLDEVDFFTSLGMSREDAAKRMGVSPDSITRALRNARRTNLAQAPTMQRALEHAFADEAGAA